MPGSPTTLGAGLGLDAKTGRAAVAARTVYMALLSVTGTTAAPTADTTLATMAGELAVAGYARQAVTFTAPAGSPRVTSNAAAITWGPFDADPPVVTHIALVSAASGTVGDLIAFWAVNTQRDAAIGDSISANAGAITLQES